MGTRDAITIHTRLYITIVPYNHLSCYMGGPRSIIVSPPADLAGLSKLEEEHEAQHVDDL